MGRVAKTDSLLKAREQLSAARLANLGARTGVVYQWTKLLTMDNIRSIIRKVTGATPASGMMPHSVEWFRGFKDRLIHGKLFMGIYENILKQGGDVIPIEQFEKAFNLYAIMSREPLLSINIADNLVKLTHKSKQIGLRICKQCQNNYLELVNERTTLCQACQWNEEFYCRTRVCRKPLPRHTLELNRRGKKRQYCDECNLQRARSRQVKSSAMFEVHSLEVVGL